MSETTTPTATMEKPKKNTLLILMGKTTTDDEEGLDDDSEELVWANLKFVDDMIKNNATSDNLNTVQLMGMTARAYFRLYPTKTPADLEREFRARDFATGLIAARWRDDKNLRPLVENGTVVVKRLSVNATTGKVDVIQDDSVPNCEYYVMYSCRPRQYVVEETLQYASSEEENLQRLETAGDIGVKNKDALTPETIKEAEQKADQDLLNGEAKEEEEKMGGHKKTELIGADQADFLKQLGDAKIRLCFHTVCMETEWNKAQDDHPGAEITALGMMAGGALLTVLVDEGDIVCPYGRMASGGDVTYVPLSSLNLQGAGN